MHRAIARRVSDPEQQSLLQSATKESQLLRPLRLVTLTLILLCAAPLAAQSLRSPAVTPTPSASIAPAPSMDLWADHVLYDGEHANIIARGNVLITTTGGLTMQGRYFAMDVKANRFVLAGHIHITDAQHNHLEGAAFASLLNYARSYYLPLINGPDRWTFLQNDLAHPLKGRENPGDAFALPEDPHGRPWISAKHVRIAPLDHLLFGPSILNTGLVDLPVPRYFLNLSSNPYFAQNSLTGAHWDASYPFAGSAYSSTTFHIREAQNSGVFGAIEEHIASHKGYVVASISPLDHELKQYNILTSEHITKKLEFDGFGQENAFQQGFSQPLNASMYANGRITQALHDSYLQLSIDQYYQSVLGDPHNACECYNDISHAFIPNHPVQLQLQWVGFDQRIQHLPIHYRLRSGFGYAHQLQGFTPLANSNFASAIFATPINNQYPSLVGGGVQNVTNTILGVTVYSSALRLNRDRHGNTINLVASVDKQRQAFSLPHHIDTTATSLSISKLYGTKFGAFLAYTIKNVGDTYGSQQSIAYAPDPQLPGFQGFATNRATTESLVFTPHPDFTFTLTGQQNHDFPTPVPNYFGQAPGMISGDLRTRLFPHLTIDLSRSYYLPHFGTMHWSNQFGVLLGG